MRNHAGTGGNRREPHIWKHEKNKLRQICLLDEQIILLFVQVTVFYFSSVDFFWKKECTGCSRLMRKGIRAEKNEKDDAGYFLKVS